MQNKDYRLDLIRGSLIGGAAGDALGYPVEFDRTNDYNFEMFTEENGFTDDTICTVAVADAFRMAPTSPVNCLKGLFIKGLQILGPPVTSPV